MERPICRQGADLGISVALDAERTNRKPGYDGVSATVCMLKVDIIRYESAIYG